LVEISPFLKNYKPTGTITGALADYLSGKIKFNPGTYDAGVPVGTFTGVKSGNAYAVVGAGGQIQYVTRDEAVQKGYINPSDNFDLSGVKRFTSFTSEFPDVVKALNDNFAQISQTFSVISPGGQGTKQAANSKIPTGLPGQSLTDSAKMGLGQAGDFLKSNPLILVGGIALVGLMLLRRK